MRSPSPTPADGGGFTSPRGKAHAALPDRLAALANGLPPGWEVDFDSDGEEPYYYTPSGETTWDRPT